MYDAIIIGAGPTGTTTAKTLAENDMNVLVVERMKLPRNKSCSGMLIKKTVDLVKKYFGEIVPDSVKCIPYDNCGMFFTDKNGKEFVFKQDALNVWRSKFDYWLIEKAIATGVELRDETSALSCKLKDDYVEVTLHSDEEYGVQAKYVVDCEGAVSSFKQTISRKKQEHITTFQTFNNGMIDLDPHYFYAFLQPELSEYDAWFNVKDEMLVLGVAVEDSTKIPFYYDKFIQYMVSTHKLKITKEIKKERWVMPYIRNDFQIDYGQRRVFYAGEVAGFLNPMGEGISSGIESGYSIAQAIISHFSNPDAVLTDYIKRTEELKAYMERQWNLVDRMISN